MTDTNATLTEEEARMHTIEDAGRMSLYKTNSDTIDNLVLRCGAEGYSDAQIAACIGVSKVTLHNWISDYPQFREIYNRAKTLSQSWWEGAAMRGTANSVIGGSVWSKSMAARFPEDYTERKETIATVKQHTTLDVEQLSTDALREIVAAKNAAEDAS